MGAGRVMHVRKDRYTRYIGRGRGARGTWGNPYRIGAPHPLTGEPMTREDAVHLHMEWMVRGEGRRLLARLGELEGHVLGCWCSPKGGLTEHDEPYACHGQNLLKLLSWRRKKLEEKRAADEEARGAGALACHQVVPERGGGETA